MPVKKSLSSINRRQLLFQVGGTFSTLTIPSFARPGYSATTGCVSEKTSALAQCFGPERVVRRSRAMLRAALDCGFGIQYWGETFTTQDLANAPHGVLIIETSRVGFDPATGTRERTFSPNEIREIRNRRNKSVIGYLNVAEAEFNRDYWLGFDIDPSRLENTALDLPFIGPRTLSHERLVRYWTEEWETILNDRVDRLMRLGCSGIMLDDVLHYYSYLSDTPLDWMNVEEDTRRLPPENLGFAGAMAQLIIRLSRRARSHNPDAIIIVNNGVFLESDAEAKREAPLRHGLMEEYYRAIDGILVESMFGVGASDAVHERLNEQYLKRGISVMTVDFVDQFPFFSEKFSREVVSLRARLRGYVPYVASDALYNRLAPPQTGDSTKDKGLVQSFAYPL